MDYRKTILYFAVALIAFMLWNAWQQDYRPAATPTPQPPTATAVGLPPSSAFTTPSNQPTEPVTTVSKRQQVITVTTDLFDIKIDTQGGNIVSLRLLKYPVSYKTPNIPVELLSNNTEHFYVAQSGLSSKEGPDTAYGQGQYSSAQPTYNLVSGAQQLEVPLKWTNNKGVTVTKLFVFDRGSYQIRVQYLIDNKSATPWNGNFYAQLQRLKPPSLGGLFSLHTFEGAALSSPEKAYEKISFDGLAKQNIDRSVQGGWLALQQRYFLSAWVPNPDQTYHYYSTQDTNQIFTVGTISPNLQIAPGAALTLGAKFYAGPEIKEQLDQVAPNLQLTIDFGFLWPLASGILWIMEKINQYIGNWGWSIVLVTLLIKLVFYKLSEKSYRSMAIMRQLTPRLQLLRERYKDDKQKLSQATMELYRQEKANPLTGCLPMIIQIPFFIALYYVLLEAVQLRQAPFVLWIHDLSIKDPYYVLPILMGLSMFLQQKLNPEPPDPMQAKMMMLLPVVFTVFFLAFPAGLVLYWLTNNCVSILQQWYIMYRLEKEEKTKRQKR